MECPQGRILGAGRCLPRDYVCDSIVDCVGGTDEQDCPGYMYRIGLIFVVQLNPFLGISVTDWVVFWVYRISSIRCRSCVFFLLYVLLRLLFEGGVYIFLAAPDINDSWVLLSVVETSCSYYTNSPSLVTTTRNYSHTVHSLVPRPRPAFRRFPSLSGWKAGRNLGTRLHCACATYTSCFEGRIYFTSSFRLCGNYQ